MKLHRFIWLSGLCLGAVSLAQAQTLPSLPKPHYQFIPGQTLQYLIQTDPYFADPAAAMETTDPNAPYRTPVMQRLTEDVLAVGKDGTGNVKVTWGPEPGFEAKDISSSSITQTFTVTPQGQIVSPLGAPAVPEFLREFFRLPCSAVNPPTVIETRSRGHDGVLLQTTRCARTDRRDFDTSAGNLRRQICTMTITLSLVMTERGKRGGADFGRVVPNVQLVQTMTIERRDDLSAVARQPLPSVVAAALLPRMH